MKPLALVFPALLAASPAMAQVSPTPGHDDPRVQTVTPLPGAPIRLVAFPGAPLTLVMLPGEPIERVSLSDASAFEVKIIGHNDALSIAPLRTGAVASMTVATTSQDYLFELETASGLAAAYLVRLVAAGAPELVEDASLFPDLAQMAGSYRLRGDHALRPSEIADDGARTYIRWDAQQALPAVFGIGPTGEEEVVNGYMRAGDLFTIDRVYGALVFRIDKAKAEARRLPEQASR